MSWLEADLEQISERAAAKTELRRLKEERRKLLMTLHARPWVDSLDAMADTTRFAHWFSDRDRELAAVLHAEGVWRPARFEGSI